MRVLTHPRLRYILFHHQTTTTRPEARCGLLLRYILFHHQTTTHHQLAEKGLRCVISSFITKPQHTGALTAGQEVALYPLSSPNHNLFALPLNKTPVALYPLSSPNHNPQHRVDSPFRLRYILFHHQTTTTSGVARIFYLLRYILFHHQTTT